MAVESTRFFGHIENPNLEGFIGLDLADAVGNSAVTGVVEVGVILESKKGIDRRAYHNKAVGVGCDLDWLSKTNVDVVFHCEVGCNGQWSVSG